MDRRRFVAIIGSAAAAPLVRAQSPGAVRSLGVLSPFRPRTPEQNAASPNRAYLRSQGWIEGKNLVVERVFASGRPELLPELAAELVRKRVEIIWAEGPEAAVAAARATKTIPIVFWGVPLPVEQGLIDSFARPGGNVTGIAWSTGTGLINKSLQIVGEIAPRVRRVSGISVPTTLDTVTGERLTEPYAEFERGARSAGFEFQRHIVRQRGDFDAAFAAILKARAQAIIVPPNALTWPELRRIVDFTNSNRLISIFGSKEWVDAGGFFSYGPDVPWAILTTFGYVDKILRGAKPADLPVELPSKYEFAINLNTAKIIGLTVPQSMLMRADRVIE